jgi:hypothetical protein
LLLKYMKRAGTTTKVVIADGPPEKTKESKKPEVVVAEPKA